MGQRSCYTARGRNLDIPYQPETSVREWLEDLADASG